MYIYFFDARNAKSRQLENLSTSSRLCLQAYLNEEALGRRKEKGYTINPTLYIMPFYTQRIFYDNHLKALRSDRLCTKIYIHIYMYLNNYLEDLVADCHLVKSLWRHFKSNENI